VIASELSEGHARALLGAGDAASIEELADRIVRGRLTVRATEALVRERSRKKSAAQASASTDGKSASLRDLEQRLTRALGTKVEVRDRGNRGEVVIPYGDLDALDRLLDKIM
jgi:ParB family chromosome partitioning protein